MIKRVIRKEKELDVFKTQVANQENVSNGNFLKAMKSMMMAENDDDSSISSTNSNMDYNYPEEERK